MNQLNTLIFRVALSCLAFWTLSPILFMIFGVEFNDSELQEVYELVRFWCIPFCILLTLFGTIEKGNTAGEKLLIIIPTLIVAVIAFFIMVMSFFVGMCNWVEKEVLFIHKKNKAITIVEREYGCGATDSSPPTKAFFKIRKWNSYLITAHEIDLNELDAEVWISSKQTK